jgi:hypothetical protein
MTLDVALTKLLNRYIDKCRAAEDAGDHELVAVYELRRNRLSALAGFRANLAHRQNQGAWRDEEFRRHGEDDW